MTRRITGGSVLGELAAASKVTYPLVTLSRTKLIYEYIVSKVCRNIKKRNKKKESKTKSNHIIKSKV